MIFLELFATFFMIGAVTFGGGYAMLPMIQEQVGLRWGHIISQQSMIDFVAVSESTPGPIAINSATFVGYRVAGVLGSVCATLGVVLPSFVIILLLSFVLRQFQELEAVRYAFFGIRAGVLALLCKSLWTMYKKSPKGWAAYVVMGGAFVVSTFFDINILFVIIGCAIFGLVTSRIMERRAAK
jgi:chromate transporter